MSTAAVTGAAALLWAYKPTLSATQVMTQLYTAGETLGTAADYSHPSYVQTQMRRLDACDAVVLADYDKGLFADGVARRLIEAARARGIPVAADPKRELSRFRGASLVKPNLAEACAAVGGHGDDFESRVRLLEKLREQLAGAEIVVTRGAAGISALGADGRAFDVPTPPLAVYVVQGAGDTSLAALVCCRSAGASLREACVVANAAAGLAIAKVGTAAVGLAELRARLAETGGMQRGDS